MSTILGDMKAAVYYQTGPPEVFRYEDVPDPECHPRGVVIDVEAISIEGGDVLHRSGGELTSRPHVVGYQAAGTISAVGAKVTDRRVGQRVVAVMGAGSHAEKAGAPARQTWVVPDALDLQQAAAVPVAFGTADDCLFEFGHLQGGETVLIHAGAGGVGLAAIQLAKRAGATVFATASSDDKLARLRELGLDHGINYRQRDFVSAVRELTEGRGVDLVVDPVGGKTLHKSFDALAYRGRAVNVGWAGRDDSMPNVRLLMQKNASLTGVYLGAEMQLHPERVHPLIAGHLEDIARGELQVVIARTFPLAEAAAAHAFIESRQAFGRVVLVP